MLPRPNLRQKAILRQNLNQPYRVLIHGNAEKFGTPGGSKFICAPFPFLLAFQALPIKAVRPHRSESV